jgi:Flp pilus assembly protein TadG
MRRFIMSKTGRARGQSLAEFAIVLPVLMVIVLGTIDLGRVFFAYISVTNAARNGAHYASTDPAHTLDVAGIREAALADTGQLTGTSLSNPRVAVATGNDSLGYQYAEVTVNYRFETLFSWPGLPGSIDMHRTVRAMVGE